MMRIILLLTGIVLLASCRPTRKIQTAITKKDTSIVVINSPRSDSTRLIMETLQKLKSARLSYTTFSAKLDIDYRGADGKNNDANVNVRMYRDSALWISVTGLLGIEGMRALVTKDSIRLLDKLNNIYTARSIDYLQEVTALPLDLPTLQNLIIGNAIFVDSNVVSFTRNNNLLSLLSIGQWFKNLITIDPANNYLVHSKLDDVNVARNRTAELIYAEYETKKGYPFSTKRRIIVAERKRLDLTLDFKQYEIDREVSFPFSVPKNFERN